MSCEFREDTWSRRRDPLDAPDQDFDWDKVYAALDETTSEPDAEALLGEVVTRLLQLLVPTERRRIYARSLGLRLLALAWVLNPGYFEGSPSLRELARRANVTPAKLARHTARFSHLLRWRNRAQSHAWNWGKGQRSRLGDAIERRQAARASHPSRGTSSLDQQ